MTTKRYYRFFLALFLLAGLVLVRLPEEHVATLSTEEVVKPLVLGPRHQIMQKQSKQRSKQTEQQRPVLPNVFYTHARTDRSGAVILDMLLAHAFAFQHNLTYAGACVELSSELDSDDEEEKEKLAVHQSLIDTLGLSDVLRFACPESPAAPASADDNADESSLFLDRQVYTRYDTDLFTPAWLAHMHFLSNRTDDTLPKNATHVAVHIRRGDVTPCHEEDFRYLPNQHYLTILQQVLESLQNTFSTDERKSIQVTIYSEWESMEDWHDFDNYQLELDTPVTEVWNKMLEADVLILSKSSFSLVPAILKTGAALDRNTATTIYYTPFWYRPLADWKVVDDDLVRTSTRLVQRMKREWC